MWLVEDDIFQCGGSALIRFLFRGRKWLVLSVRIEIYWVFVSWHRNRFDIKVGIETDLISVMGSKLTWFLCTASKLTWLKRRDRPWLFFCAGIKIDLGFACGPKITLNISIEFCLVCIVEIEIVLVFVCRRKITWCWCEYRTWLRFCVGSRYWLDFIVGDRTWRGFSVGIGIDLVLVGGSKMTWF